MSKTVKVEASYKDELGKATNLTLTLILCIDDNKAPDFKKGGFGVLVDITDESKGVFDKFPCQWSQMGLKKAVLDFGYNCEDWENAKDETANAPKGYRYLTLELPEKIEPGQIIKTLGGATRNQYAISSVLDF